MAEPERKGCNEGHQTEEGKSGNTDFPEEAIGQLAPDAGPMIPPVSSDMDRPTSLIIPPALQQYFDELTEKHKSSKDKAQSPTPSPKSRDITSVEESIVAKDVPISDQGKTADSDAASTRSNESAVTILRNGKPVHPRNATFSVERPKERGTIVTSTMAEPEGKGCNEGHQTKEGKSENTDFPEEAIEQLEPDAGPMIQAVSSDMDRPTSLIIPPALQQYFDELTEKHNSSKDKAQSPTPSPKSRDITSVEESTVEKYAPISDQGKTASAATDVQSHSGQGKPSAGASSSTSNPGAKPRKSKPTRPVRFPKINVADWGPPPTPPPNKPLPALPNRPPNRRFMASPSTPLPTVPHTGRPMAAVAPASSVSPVIPKQALVKSLSEAPLRQPSPRNQTQITDFFQSAGEVRVQRHRTKNQPISVDAKDVNMTEFEGPSPSSVVQGLQRRINELEDAAKVQVKERTGGGPTIQSLATPVKVQTNKSFEDEEEEEDSIMVVRVEDFTYRPPTANPAKTQPPMSILGGGIYSDPQPFRNMAVVNTCSAYDHRPQNGHQEITPKSQIPIRATPTLSFGPLDAKCSPPGLVEKQSIGQMRSVLPAPSLYQTSSSKNLAPGLAEIPRFLAESTGHIMPGNPSISSKKTQEATGRSGFAAKEPTDIPA
ncbi:hypothetical protein HYQ46_011957 [Verticillium longisporum]|nr:hypothetical protein HYQ46_011957 [Verticillium longisporum]